MIGSYSSEYFNGSISGVKIYNRALSADELPYFIKKIVINKKFMKDKRTICKQCNKVFYTFQSENRLFCCNDCYLKYKRENANVEKLICLECGKKFTARKDFHQKFCSKQCSSLYRFKQHNIYKICEYCGKEFRVSKCHIDRKYCSKKCQGKTYKTTRSGKKGVESFLAVGSFSHSQTLWAPTLAFSTPLF